MTPKLPPERQSETPRTDAFCNTPIMGYAMTPHKWDALQAHARQLERELAEHKIHWQADVAAARRVADDLRRELAEFMRIADTHSEEIIRLRRELAEAHTLLAKERIAMVRAQQSSAAAPDELHEMQLAAIMTASIQNTPESAKQRIGPDNPYWTQAYADVCAAVDIEMVLRAAPQSAIGAPQFKHFAARCRPAIKADLLKCEQAILKCKDGTFAPHYKVAMERDADRAQRLLDEIDALIGPDTGPHEPPVPPHHIPVA